MLPSPVVSLRAAPRLLPHWFLLPLVPMRVTSMFQALYYAHRQGAIYCVHRTVQSIYYVHRQSAICCVPRQGAMYYIHRQSVIYFVHRQSAIYCVQTG